MSSCDYGRSSGSQLAASYIHAINLPKSSMMSNPPHTAQSLPQPPPKPPRTFRSKIRRIAYEMRYLTAQGAVFVAGTPQGQTIQGTCSPPIPAHQLALTDSSANTADIDGVAVFYNSKVAI